MNRRRVLALTLASALSASAVSASPAQEETRACVEASTRGQTERDEGRLRAAREQLLACAADSCPSIVREHCAEWLADVERRIPSVVVRVMLKESSVDLPGASVCIDGVAAALDGRPVPLDPGVHTIAVDAPGTQAIEQPFLLAEREKARLLIVELRALAPKARAAPAAASAHVPPLSAQAPHDTRFAPPVGAWVLGGVGLLSLGAFAYLGSRAKRERDELARTCAPYCSEAQRRPAENMALAADVLLGVGVAGLVGAGAWSLGMWLRQRRAAPRAKVVLWSTPRGPYIALRGHY